MTTSRATAAVWDKYIDPSEAVQVVNPKEGFIASANNKVAPASYPYLLLNDMVLLTTPILVFISHSDWLPHFVKDWEVEYREKRIRQLIDSLSPLDVAEMIAMQADTVTLLWSDMKSVLQVLYQTYPSLPYISEYASLSLSLRCAFS